MSLKWSIVLTLLLIDKIIDAYIFGPNCVHFKCTNAGRGRYSGGCVKCFSNISSWQYKYSGIQAVEKLTN